MKGPTSSQQGMRAEKRVNCNVRIMCFGVFSLANECNLNTDAGQLQLSFTQCTLLFVDKLPHFLFHPQRRL